MANFDNTQSSLQSASEAVNLLNAIRSVYAQCKATQRLMLKYQENQDQPFRNTVNAIFTAAERTELGVMLGNINTLVTAWEANHRAALGLPTGGDS